LSAIAERLATIRARIERAAKSVNRDPSRVKLLAVSKTHGADRVREAAAVGQKFEGVAKAHAIELFHELDRIARRAAAETVKESFVRGDDERRVLVVVERTFPDQVFRSVLLELDPARAHECGQVHGPFQPVDLFIRDSGHGGLLLKKASSST
jgi:alkanesulfonate monooxygenase SsuD/methylene tetrahydromethanopterin reductase-like flavin-dependent oxidoreductase (luciferase family)